MSNPAASLPPGFRFHPTDEELVLHYLTNRAASLPGPVSIIADVDIYKFDPWDLPGKAMFGDREWYFFSPRERKYPNGVRPNRAAASGYWKATGTDKPVAAAAGKGKGSIGVKKALVFYKGRPPKGVKTDWIMHEYRLTQARNHHGSKPTKLGGSSMRLDDWVLCRIYKKNHHHLPSTARAPADSGGDDAHLSNPPNINQQDNLKLQSSSSLCELLEAADYSILSRLFDSPPELLGSEQCHLAGYASPVQPFISSCDYSSNGNSYSLRPLTGGDLHVPITWSCPKRRRMADGCSEEGGGASSSSC